MGYVHHYYPALLFSSMLTGVLIDHLLEKMCSVCPASLSGTIRHTILGLVVGAVCYTFYIFSPLVYGMSGTEATRGRPTQPYTIFTGSQLGSSNALPLVSCAIFSSR